RPRRRATGCGSSGTSCEPNGEDPVRIDSISRIVNQASVGRRPQWCLAPNKPWVKSPRGPSALVHVATVDRSMARLIALLKSADESVRRGAKAELIEIGPFALGH